MVTGSVWLECDGSFESLRAALSFALSFVFSSGFDEGVETLEREARLDFVPFSLDSLPATTMCGVSKLEEGRGVGAGEEELNASPDDVSSLFFLLFFVLPPVASPMADFALPKTPIPVKFNQRNQNHKCVQQTGAVGTDKPLFLKTNGNVRRFSPLSPPTHSHALHRLGWLPLAFLSLLHHQ